MVTKTIRTKKYSGGSIINPRGFASGVNGRINPANTVPRDVTASHLLGRLKKNGDLEVLITNTTSTCVAKDSTNHPVLNSVPLA